MNQLYRLNQISCFETKLTYKLPQNMYYTSRKPQKYPITHPHTNLHLKMTNDVGLEQTTYRHAYLLRQQAQIQRYKLTNLSTIAPLSQINLFGAAYKQQVQHKQQRILQLLYRNTSSKKQHQNLRKIMLEQQLNYQQILQQMELNGYCLFNRRKNMSLNSYKPHSHIIANIDSTLPKDFSNRQKRQSGRYQSIDGKRLSETYEGINSNKDRSKMDKKQKMLRQYQRNSWSNNQVERENVKFKSKVQAQNDQISKDIKNRLSLNVSSTQNISSQRAKQDKTRNRVSFDLSNNFTTYHPSQTQAISPSLQPEFLSSNHALSNNQITQIDFKQSGQTKIQNRISLSKSIYRDSQHKNIKHEHIHLIKTYQNQLNQRQALKKRINNDPKVIDKQSLVLQSVQ